MKKKLMLIVILLFIGIILFLENVCKISVFENVKHIIGQAKMSNNMENNITIIDVTDLEENRKCRT